LNDLPSEIEELSALGIPAVILFGIPAHKDAEGSSSLLSQGVIQQAIRCIRDVNPDLLIIADACFCEYTNHGHCGILQNQTLNNDLTLEALAQQAVSYANAGADWIAPSGMADGMVQAIREALDATGHSEIAILSYAVKYASTLYGPFREAAEGAPQFGDRKTYQMNPANAREALREADLDIQEGADLLMVKPAMLYLDILHEIKQRYPEVPLCAYQVSGEYAMIKAAAAQGILDEQQTFLESLTAIKRAGADLMVSYAAKEMAKLLA
jgi:porphobilinogen synthase